VQSVQGFAEPSPDLSGVADCAVRLQSDPTPYSGIGYLDFMILWTSVHSLGIKAALPLHRISSLAGSARRTSRAVLRCNRPSSEKPRVLGTPVRIQLDATKTGPTSPVFFWRQVGDAVEERPFRTAKVGLARASELWAQLARHFRFKEYIHFLFCRR